MYATGTAHVAAVEYLVEHGADFHTESGVRFFVFCLRPNTTTKPVSFGFLSSSFFFVFQEEWTALLRGRTETFEYLLWRGVVVLDSGSEIPVRGQFRQI